MGFYMTVKMTRSAFDNHLRSSSIHPDSTFDTRSRAAFFLSVFLSSFFTSSALCVDST